MKIDSPNILSQLGVSGSAEISGSLNVLGSVTAESFPGLLSSSAQVSYPGLSNIPAGIVSGSAQVKDLLPAGTISGSGQIQLNQLSGTTFSSSNFTFPQELIVQGKLTAQEFHTELVSSSIIYESGSTKFGDSLDDTHSFTGSVEVLGGITGSLKATNGIVSGSSQVQLGQISGTTFASSDFSFPQDVTISGSVGIQRAEEKTTVTATAADGTVNFDFLTQSILYYTANASGNWTLNIRGNGSTTFDSVVETGKIVTVVFLVTNGNPAYYQTALQIDGSAVTPKWQGAITPVAGSTDSIDSYAITILKTGAGTFTVLEAVTQFK